MAAPAGAAPAALPRRPRVIVVVYEDYARDSRVRRHVRALAGAGYDVRVLALGDAGTVDVAVSDGARLSALVGRKYRGARKAAYIISYARFAILVTVQVIGALPRGLAAVWVNNPPDLLLFAALPAKLGRVPIVLDVHDMSSDLYAAKFGAPGARRSPAVAIVGWIVRFVESLAYRAADALLTVHGSYADRIRARAGRGTPVADVLNVPDAPGWIERGDARDPMGRRSGRLVLGHHGTIAERFGVDLAVRAVRALVDDGLDVELRILGDGDAAGAIEPLARELGLEGRIHHDRRTFRPEEIPAFLEPVDILVAPYRRSAFVDELLPVKVLEAVILGAAVVATSTRALRRHLDDDVIAYLEEPTVEAIAAAIRSLADPAVRAERWRHGRLAARSLAWPPQRDRLLAWFSSVARR